MNYIKEQKKSIKFLIIVLFTLFIFEDMCKLYLLDCTKKDAFGSTWELKVFEHTCLAAN